MSNMGTRVKKLREKHSLTQKQLAEILGYKSDRSIQFIEYGKSDPDIEGLIILAKHFNVSIDYLVGHSNDPSPPNSDPIDEGMMERFLEVENNPDLKRLLDIAKKLNLNQLDSVTRFIESFSE
jgi:transcriptional regulator with XRE-family HTH domain